MGGNIACVVDRIYPSPRKSTRWQLNNGASEQMVLDALRQVSLVEGIENFFAKRVSQYLSLTIIPVAADNPETVSLSRMVSRLPLR